MGKRLNVDYIIYTDGGCTYNPGGPGGCAAIVTNTKTGERTEYSEAYGCTTNNRMEIMAVILGMETIPDGSSVLLCSDSTYVLNTMNGQYRKKKNVDLWKRLDTATKRKFVQTRWVKGHSGIPENERCDQLCLLVMNEQIKKIDTGYLDSKEAGRQFYEKMEHVKSGAMGISIELPEPFASETFSFYSPKQYCDKYQVHRDCAKSILDFFMLQQNTFKSYVAIKSGGLDFWSRKSKDYMIQKLEEQGMEDNIIRLLFDTIKTYITLEKEQLACLRWYMRGLPLRDSIRKVLVNMEVAQNC